MIWNDIVSLVLAGHVKLRNISVFNCFWWIVSVFNWLLLLQVLQISDILEYNGACNDQSVAILLVFLASQLVIKKNMVALEVLWIDNWFLPVSFFLCFSLSLIGSVEFPQILRLWLYKPREKTFMLRTVLCQFWSSTKPRRDWLAQYWRFQLCYLNFLVSNVYQLVRYLVLLFNNY